MEEQLVYIYKDYMIAKSVRSNERPDEINENYMMPDGTLIEVDSEE